ncbi:helix-turn-helix domain-containing protein [Bacteroides caecimuris]|uniref:XRE family transcriptional regulator n=1 Tax=Bacteroides caecimuris TaxID=1796613 RepID=A0A4S2CBH3_9BACE|nr:helix-turn-helix transcriptional regulator [Bacteroides caecimuris]TGY25126.1 XRE family transcriptional regulator [Bacteroides caecimuris]
MVHLERIKELCEKKNVTMKQAAIELGMTEQSLHKIIKANSTKIDTLLSISQYFNVEPAYFFDNYLAGASDGVYISKKELDGLIKKVIAYSIHGFGLVKLEWDTMEQKFNSYFDRLKKQYSPDASDLKYISSLLETDVHITDKTTPKDVARVLMTKDEFDFTSTYYYGIRRMEVQEELQKITAFLDKHNIPISDSIKKDLDELKGRIKYYEGKSIIGNNKI